MLVVLGGGRVFASAPHRLSAADHGEPARGAAGERFLFRARGATRDDPLGETLFEINALADTLKDERLGSLEATALLRTVMSEIDVAVFAFDDEHKLRLVNRAGERLLGRPVEQLLGEPRTTSAWQRVSTAARPGC